MVAGAQERTEGQARRRLGPSVNALGVAFLGLVEGGIQWRQPRAATCGSTAVVHGPA